MLLRTYLQKASSNSNMTETKSRWRRAWVALGAAAMLLFTVFAIKHYYDTRDLPWSLVAPRQYVDVATRMAELRNNGHFDEAVELGLHSMKGQGDDFLFQMIATTYFTRAFQDKDRSGDWAKLAAEYSEKARDADPTDLANLLNVGVNYTITGDYLSTGGCEYYRKARAVFESLVPRLQGDRAETQGRTVRLAPFRRRNQEEISRISDRLRSCK
jgi:hypothetical protein